MGNTLYYGDNPDIPRRNVADETVDRTAATFKQAQTGRLELDGHAGNE